LHKPISFVIMVEETRQITYVVQNE